jgi:hypothetical protein
LTTLFAGSAIIPIAFTENQRLVAQPKDESKSQVLPDPELNPLLNPLLAAHMGRWAEVYFTSPPEKRAQAVSELVRELANNSTPGYVSTESSGGGPGNQSVHDKAETAKTEDSLANSGVPSLTCESCGHRNSVVQRFCGMCGSPLTTWSQNSNSSQDAGKAQPLSAAAWDEPSTRFSETIDHHDAAADSLSSRDTLDRGLPGDVPPPFAEESPVPFEVLSSYDSEPVSSSYRVYVGVVLAILLSLLVYMTWRGNSAFWSSGTAPSALPRAVPTPAEPEPAKTAEPLASKNAPPTPKETATNSAPKATPQTAREGGPSAARSERDRSENTRRESARPAARVVPVTASSPTSAVGQNGSEELAMAERYLNGRGTLHDTRQASSWLWKAVAKQNLTATLLLADLYLRGDGVTKSCDQGRLLLVAAARKGQSAAAERLRNLQAFGCQ